MYSPERHMAKLEHSSAILFKKRKKQLITLLTILCLMISVSLLWMAGALIGRAKSYVPGLYGSTMLSEDVGGYVLVGVLAFSAAVVITVLCIRHREKEKINKGRS